MAEPPVAVVGLQGGEWFGAAAGAALRGADVLAGAPRHLAALPGDLPGERRASSSVDDLVATAAAARA
ncbi:MAG TPA: hypothetical protein VM263_10665 [Acidimicrobiales bacterium]|nr:hypothetical protein [Acidimicrobiales bacterium]